MIKDKDNLSILFAGDAMLGENIYHFGRSIRTKYNRKYAYLIPKKIKDSLFLELDAFIFNFECSLVPDDYPFSEINESIYTAPINSLQAFPRGLLKIVNIANNHFAQHGEKRTKYTIDALKSNNFIITGENNKPTKVFLKHKSLLIWGVTLVNKDTGIFCSNFDTLIDDLDIPNTKSPEEIWVISIHWGTEYMSYPDANQRDMARKLAGLGFDIIHGHHPHVYQPMEKIDKALIMYSLGNFIFDQNFSKKTKVAVLPLITMKSNQKKIKAFMVENNNYQPTTLSEIDSIDSLMLKKRSCHSDIEKFMINQKYRILSKLEFLPNIAKDDLLVLKYLYSRYKRKLKKR